jgi:hypothetical protein
MYYVETKEGFVFETSDVSLHHDCIRLTKTEGEKRVKQEALRNLRDMLEPGNTVYTVIRHVSASGMSRRIDLYTIQKNRPVFLSGYAAKAIGWKWSDKGGIVVNGCGMDMGFHLVYTLSLVLFPDGFKDGQDREKSGGYALRHEWL